MTVVTNPSAKEQPAESLDDEASSSSEPFVDREFEPQSGLEQSSSVAAAETQSDRTEANGVGPNGSVAVAEAGAAEAKATDTDVASSKESKKSSEGKKKGKKKRKKGKGASAKRAAKGKKAGGMKGKKGETGKKKKRKKNDKASLDKTESRERRAKKTKKPAQPSRLKELSPSLAEFERIQRELDSTEAELAKVRDELDDMNERQEREDLLVPFQVELLKLQRSLEADGRRMIVLFEGRDAAGKGGTIRRVTRYMNEKHYRVVALGKPTEEQRSQWYLQRYVAEFPRGGEIVLFDRSWYNRAMVEPVFGFCSDKEYEDFLRGVVGFEKDLVRQETVVVKLYFSVSKKEQQRRFTRRQTDPLRQWKLSEIDMQAQEHWDEFTSYKYQMLRRTHTSQTPWTVIRAENKPLARLNAMKVILNSIDYPGRNAELDFVPDPELVLSGAHEVDLMEADRLRKGKFKA